MSPRSVREVLIIVWSTLSSLQEPNAETRLVFATPKSFALQEEALVRLTSLNHPTSSVYQLGETVRILLIAGGLSLPKIRWPKSARPLFFARPLILVEQPLPLAIRVKSATPSQRSLGYAPRTLFKTQQFNATFLAVRATFPSFATETPRYVPLFRFLAHRKYAELPAQVAKTMAIARLELINASLSPM